MTDERPAPSGDRLRTVALTLFVVLAVLVILVQGRAILLPIAIAVVVWYIIVALSGAFARLRLGGARIPPFWCGAGAVALVFLAGMVFVELIRRSIGALAEAAPRYEARLEEIIGEVAILLGLENTLTLERVAGDIDLEAVAGYFLASASSIVFDFIMIFFYVVFLLIQQRFMPAKLAALVPDPDRQAATRTLILKIHRELQKYIGVMVFLACVTGAVTYVVLVAVGVDFAILWSVIIALSSFIPTIGTAFGIAFPACIALLQFGMSSEFLVVLTVLAAAQILLNNVAQPALMGRSLNLSPFVVLVALSVWGAIWGIVGAVLSVPITVAMALVFSHVRSTRWVAVLLSTGGKAA